MSYPIDKYQFAKKELLKILIAVLVLILVGIKYYFYIRKQEVRSVEKRVEMTLKNAEASINRCLGKIETVVNSIGPMAEYMIDDPEAMYDIAYHTVESSSHIMGAGVAFKENYYPNEGRWYETYAGHRKNLDTLFVTQLGSEEHDYLQMDWFKKGLASEKGFWSAPYYDNAGGMAYMISYCLPISDSTGETVGVICTDVTLDTLASIVSNIKLYPHSFCTLVTTDGSVLVAPPSVPKTKGRYHVFSETIDGKDMVLTITISNADMYHRLRMATLFFSILAFTGVLTVFFIAYRSVQNLWKFNEVRLKEQHIEDELSIARNIQQAMLPSETLTRSIKTIDIKGLQIPAKFVGGDLYDYYVRDNQLLFCIGDVSGKGVPAALLMAIAHSLFRTLSARDSRPEHIMQALNASISDNNPDIMFITIFIGVMDLSTGMIRYCNAGHNPPIVIRDGKVKFLDSAPSLILGVDADAEYTSCEVALLPGDTLFLYTDGLTEAENAQKELFGESRALEIATEYCRATAQEQVEKMRQSVQTFVGKAEQSDDLTMLAVRFTKGGNNTLSMSNNIEELYKLEPFLNDYFKQENLDMSLLPQLNLALEEAATNVIMYAYPEGEKGTVELSLEVMDGQICATLIDEGAPFNPLQKKEVNLDVPLEERQIGGLGIHLIRTIMDQVEYAHENGQNVLRMKIQATGNRQ